MATDNRSDPFVAAIGTRYLLRLEEDTLRERPLPIRLIIEFLGTFMLVKVAAGSGVINHWILRLPASTVYPMITSLTDRKRCSLRTQGGQHVLYGSALALTAAIHAWSRHTGTPVPSLARTTIR